MVKAFIRNKRIFINFAVLIRKLIFEHIPEAFKSIFGATVYLFTFPVTDS